MMTGRSINCGRTPTLFATVFALVLASETMPQSHAVTVYSNDFEGVIGAEWSDGSTSVTPVGNRKFLGVFQEGPVSLTLTNVPDNQEIGLSFELFVINTWDGSQLVDPLSIPPHTVGPDVWTLDIGSGLTLLSATFSVFDGTKAMHSFRNYPQAFPGNFPSASFSARTGADENDTLGYFEGDSVYSLAFSFQHASGPVVINFSGNYPEFDPEEWGIDNIVVTAIPEPSTIILAAIGLLCLVGCRKRRG